MKKIYLLWILFIACAMALGIQGCDDNKTYAEMEEEERDAINLFKSELEDSIGATFISEDQFVEQDSTTGPNEFVLFDETGVYMNVVTRGEGEVLGNGTHDILTRFIEIALSTNDAAGCHKGDTLAINWGTSSYYVNPDVFRLTISNGSYSGKFGGGSNDSENSVMATIYQTSAVPSGWLLPLRFLKVGRTVDSEKISRVRLIVPHSEGTGTAMSAVYPCYYEITYSLY